MISDYIPVGSIVVPSKWIWLCGRWHAGKSSIFYEISASGNLTAGTITPSQTTSEARYYGRYCQLVGELKQVIEMIGCDTKECRQLKAFLAWAEKQTARLRENYQLE